jgi:hypothetical protein
MNKKLHDLKFALVVCLMVFTITYIGLNGLNERHDLEIKYIIVVWPESMDVMKHDRFNECMEVTEWKWTCEFGSDAYFVPEDLYNEVYNP